MGIRGLTRGAGCTTPPVQVFGTAPDHAATSKLPQHGFARSSRWEFLGKSTSESASNSAAEDLSVKLDFGLSSSSLDAATRELWPYEFDIIYSVTLERASLATALVITNKDDKPWEFQVLAHTYLRVKVRSGDAAKGEKASGGDGKGGVTANTTRRRTSPRSRLRASTPQSTSTRSTP